MIRKPENYENAKITVMTIDGDVFLNRDIIAQPLGENEKVVAFWDGDCLVVIPLHMVKSISFSFDT